MALTTIYQLKTFADLYTAVREELKIQSTDTTAINRIKRDLNIVYLEEVVPFSNWKWLRGTFDATVYAAVTAGTATATQGSNTVTLTTAIVSRKDGWLFGIMGYNEVYRIQAHSPNSTTITLQVPYTGPTVSAANFKIWTDEIYLPSFIRETFEVTHDFMGQPLENCGLQKFRQYVAALPRAEGRPYFYTTNTYADPIAYITPSGIPAVSTRASDTLTKTIVFASDVTNYLQQGDRILVSGASDSTYNGEFVIASQTTSTITYTGIVPTYETTVSDSGITVKRAQPSSDSRRAKRLQVYPSIYNSNTTLHIDHLREVTGLADDTDEPLIPIGDRTILLYGALNRAWSRERNPEEAARNFKLFGDKLARMAGKLDDSNDQIRLVPGKVYLGSKRLVQRQRDIRSGLPEGWGGGSASGQVITGTANRAAIFDSTGQLGASTIIASSELIQLSGIGSKADGISDANTLTNKTLNITSNTISGGNASTVTIWNSSGVISSSSVTTTELSKLSGILSQAVGISDTQVLTNKTIASSANTIRGLDNSTISSSAAIARSKIASSSAGWVVTNDTNGLLAGVAPGTSGNVLTSDGTQWLSSAATGGSLDSSQQILNAGIACSVGSSALTISLVDKNGNVPTGGSPIQIGFRNPQSSTGTYVVGTVSTNTGLTLSNGSSLGSSGGLTYYPYVYALYNSGTVEVAISMMHFDEGTLQTTVAEGNGASTSNKVLYSSTARSSVPIRELGRLKINQTKAGLWSSVPTEISPKVFDKIAVAFRAQKASAQTLSNNTQTTILFDTIQLDTHNCYIKSTGEFVVPKSGLYYIAACVEYTASLMGQRANAILLNGATVTEIGNQSGPGGSTTDRISGSTVYSLTAGDRFTIQGFHTSGGNLDVAPSGVIYTWVAVTFISDKF